MLGCPPVPLFGQVISERALTVIATLKQQQRNVLDYLTASCVDLLRAEHGPSLFPPQAQMLRVASCRGEWLPPTLPLMSCRCSLQLRSPAPSSRGLEGAAGRAGYSAHQVIRRSLSHVTRNCETRT